MSWPLVPIADFCSTGSGGTPSRNKKSIYYSGGTIPWIKSGELKESVILSADEHITPLALKESSAKLVSSGAILLAMYGATVGRLAILGIEAATNQAICTIVPDSEVADVRFLFHVLRKKVPTLIAQAAGGAQPNINQGLIRELKIPMPPIDEQRRIAAMLDKAEQIRAQSRAALALLDELPQAIFLDMFGDPATNPKGLPLVRMGDVLESANYGTSGKAGPLGKWPVLRMGNLTSDGHLDLRDLKYIDLSEAEIPKYTVKNGDLLFNRTNSADLVGKTALYSADEPMAFAGYLVRLRVNGKAAPEFIAAFMNLSYTKKVLRSMAKSIVGMANINAKEVQTISLPLPPMEFQRQFAQRVGSIQRAKAQRLTAIAVSDVLFATLQDRALNEVI